MEELALRIEEVFRGSVIRAVFSKPCSEEYRRAQLRRVEGGFQLERYTATQAFHENLQEEDAIRRAKELLGTEFLSMTAWGAECEYIISISKKGKVLFSRRKRDTQFDDFLFGDSHNRRKRYIVPMGMPVPPLVDMGILTKDGKIVTSMYDKFRQINRFIEIIDDELRGKSFDRPFRVVDFGCGKSYLTFVLYYYLVTIRRMRIEMVGLDLKADVIEKCRRAAERYGYTGLTFEQGDIAGYRGEAADMVITLHACDTATDLALYHAIKWGARMIFSVPCCQHELNAQMRSERLHLITRYGIVKERTAALITDAIRANLLEYMGYSTQLLEFIEMEHTPKNILVRAVKKSSNRERKRYLAEVEALMEEFNLEPTLYRLIKEGEAKDGD